MSLFATSSGETKEGNRTYRLASLSGRTVSWNEVKTSAHEFAFQKYLSQNNGSCNFKMMIKSTLANHWKKIVKAVHPANVTNGSDFDFPSAGVISNAKASLRHVSRDAPMLLIWLEQLVNNQGHLEVCMSTAQACDTLLAPILALLPNAEHKMECMVARFAQT
jgi:hypothetical protein